MTANISYSKDFYEILDITSERHSADISPQQLRIAYKRALLAHHPDKHGARQHDANLTIDQISLAYKVLSDPTLRQEYDSALHNAGGDEELPGKFRIFHTGLDTFDLDDLTFDTTKEYWTKPCRCGDGGGFVVTEDELEANAQDGELITGCKGCSLWIKVLYSVEE